MTASTIRISEIFGPTIQGEGALIGQPTVFVRTGGCDYRCSWCDTLHAVDSAYRKDWLPITPAQIFTKVETLSGGKPIMVSLSGGNPAIQDLSSLIDLGKSKGYGFALETQGSIAADWFSKLDVLTLSPKPPSSGMNMDMAKLEECVNAAGSAQTSLKFVVLDEVDYHFARTVAAAFPNLPVYLQPCNHTPPDGNGQGESDAEGLNARMRWLVERAMQDQWFEARILPQLHVMLWGNKRGV